MKNLVRIGAGLTLFLGLGLTSYAANVENITPTDNGHISFAVVGDEKLGDEADTKLKVLKDLVATFAYKDVGNPNKVIVNLTYEMHKNTTYNLLGILGSDVNVDFTVGEEIPAEIAIEGNDEIAAVKVVDAKTLEIEFKQEPEGEEFVFKILKDLGIDTVKKDNDKEFVTALKTPLEQFSSYILLVDTMKDAEGNNVSFDDVYYEFETTDNLTEVLEPQKLEAANEPEEVVAEEEVVDGNVKEIAQKAKSTPDTGAATWVLLLATFGLSGFFFLTRRRDS